MKALEHHVPLFEHEDWEPLKREMGHPMKLPVNEVIVHHSYVPDILCGETVIKEIEAMVHMDVYATIEKKWGGFSYNYAIFQSGHVFCGRDHNRTGAHTEGRNSISQGVVFVTDGSVHSLSFAARAAFHALTTYLILLQALSPEYQLSPHDRYADKICPGPKIKAQLKILHRDILKNWPILRVGDRGVAVSYLQEFLSSVALMPVTYVAGYFGSATLEGVKQFQRDNALLPDGIVGPRTWSRIP